MNKFGIINISTGGFFSNFFVSLSTAIYCDNVGLIPYVELNNTVFSKYCDMDNVNTWNWWFEQQKPVITDEKRIISKNEYYFFKFPAPFGDINWNRADIIDSRNLFNKYFKIKPHILDICNNYYIENFKDKIVLGVMARGTEFNLIHPQYGNQTVYAYIDKVRDVLIEHPEITNIFLVTEDGDYIEIFEKYFDNILYMDVFRRTNQPLSYCQNNWLWVYENKSRFEHTKKLGDESLYQSLLLGKCDYLVCKKNGTSAGSIFFNENLKNVYYV